MFYSKIIKKLKDIETYQIFNLKTISTNDGES